MTKNGTILKTNQPILRHCRDFAASNPYQYTQVMVAVPIRQGLLNHDAEQLCYLVSKTRETLPEDRFVWGQTPAQEAFELWMLCIMLLLSMFRCVICKTCKNDILLLGADKISEGEVVTYIVTPDVMS